MQDSVLEMLEFTRVREILADYTSFSASRELVTDLRPSSDADLVSLLLRQSAEARRLLSLRPEFTIGTVFDVRKEVKMASRGKMLEPKTLVDIQNTLAAARVVRSNLSKLAGELPSLWSIGSRIVEQSHLESEIGRCITQAYDVSNSASPRLANLRRRLQDTRQQLLSRLEAILKSKSKQKFIQEPFITEREGRYVIPVKIEFKKDVKGIVHDISNTGATVFVEPWATIEMGNDLRQLVIEEKQEVERILAELSAKVGARRIEINRDVESLAEIDLALARAHYSEKVNAAEPVITIHGDDGENISSMKPGVLKLVNARHPLLRGEAVPLNVEIGDDFSILMITGPNTGGKTVALKTIGLLTLMTQAGIPIPASEKSCIPVFDEVFADIGDQQSIEQTLSTFSWHIGNVVHIIRNSTQRSLVLLDELGISTDPNEGAALAKSILLHFLESGTMTVATTHYSELKAFAHVTPGLRNASLDFDPVTLAPTYHLTMGIPGGSNAISIASRLGLPEEIIANAKQMMTRDSSQMESLLANLMSERQKCEAVRVDLEREKTKVEKLSSHLEMEAQRLKEQEQNMLRETRDRLLQDAAGLHKLIRKSESELRKAKKRESIERGKKILADIYQQVEGPLWQVRGYGEDETSSVEGAGEISPGDRVLLVDNNLEGTVISASSDSRLIEVQVGNSRLKVDVGKVEKIPPSDGEIPPGFPLVRKSLSRRAKSLELDLRGKRTDEVHGILDGYLNDAFLANFGHVRIVHGYATGALRQVVREILASHPLVKSFKAGEKGEGGDGVTVVQL